MRRASLAQELGLALCRGILPTGHYCGYSRYDHLTGRVTRQDDQPVIHLADGPLRQSDKKRFLVLAAIALDPSLEDPDQPTWRRVYRRDRAAIDIGRRLRIRIPPRALALDKSVVLAGVAGLRNDVPDRQRAFDWARR